MASQQHTFVLRAAAGAEEVFRALTKVCGHENQARFEPDFEFDWIAKRIAISANAPEGVEECLARFLEQAGRSGLDAELFLAGRVEETGGRFLRPIGVMLMDAATYGELIGRSLVDVGLRQVRVVDSAGECRIEIARNFIAQRIDYEDLIRSFPLPSYIALEDKGVADAPKPERSAPKRAKGKKRGKRK